MLEQEEAGSVAMLTRKEMRERAERTTSAATEIIEGERAASEAKTARLKALRSAREGGASDAAASDKGAGAA